MTLEEMSKTYSIGLEKLQYLADSGLLEPNADYADEELRRIGTMCRLYDMGFDADEIKKLRENGWDTPNEYRSILKHRRSRILENIHREQKKLDDIDYMIRGKTIFR